MVTAFMGKKSSLTVRLDVVTGIINPCIYGHFAEHLGRCIYPGIWVGEDSRIRNTQGLRTDIVEALKAIEPPVVRWPGGCFADDYHWKDGVGPAGRRPRRPNMWWGGEDSNEFGTDEFLRFCKSIGSEPYICLNVGSGSPDEALSWLEYCNYSGDSSISQLRAMNGHPQPYRVKYWGVGNENWGCGGSFDPLYYSWEYRRFATYLKRSDPSTHLVACGHTSRDWNLRFMEALRDHMRLVDSLSIHYYFNGRRNPFGGDINFTDDEYLNLLYDVQNLEHQIQQAIRVVDYYSEKTKSIGIIVDEWGTWHPQATLDSGLYQQSTLRDAVLASVVLNLFNRYSGRVLMANIAQTVNVLQSLCLTKGEKTIVTPTYHVFNLYKHHMGNSALMIETQSPLLKRNVDPSSSAPTSVPPKALDASASLSQDGRRLVITLVNQSLDEDLETEIRLVGDKDAQGGELALLGAADVRAYNDFDSPNTVSPTDEAVRMKGRTFDYIAPRHSVSRLILSLD